MHLIEVSRTIRWAILFAAANAHAQSPMVGAVSSLERYLDMSNLAARDYHPLTQEERTRLYLKSLVNPWGFFKSASSAAIDHAHDKPSEWGQGAAAYGKRFANITAQYDVQRTVTFALGSALREDNRYFSSGKRGVWRRCGYALATSFMARHENGRLYPSISTIGGYAAGAFTARLWLPPSQSSAADAGRSFGYSMAGNAGTALVKEFLPDIVRPLLNHNPHKKNR